MSHSTSSLDLEQRAYSGVCVSLYTQVFTWPIPTTKVTISWLLASSRLVCVFACMCVLEENESHLATKPQHRSQI